GYRASGGVGLQVTQPGRASFEWELHPVGSTGEYRLAWPSSAVTMLLLDLPEEVRCEAPPQSSALVLEASEAIPPSAEEWPTDRWPPPLTGMKRWMVTSPPTQQLTWQVRRTTATPDTTAVGSDYHQRVRYE